LKVGHRNGAFWADCPSCGKVFYIDYDYYTYGPDDDEAPMYEAMIGPEWDPEGKKPDTYEKTILVIEN